MGQDWRRKREDEVREENLCRAVRQEERPKQGNEGERKTARREG